MLLEMEFDFDTLEPEILLAVFQLVLTLVTELHLSLEGH
jgi:hypothetical protein